MPLILFAIYIGFILTKVSPFHLPINDLGMFFIYSLLAFLFLLESKVFRTHVKKKGDDNKADFTYMFLTICLFLSMIGELSDGSFLVPLLPGFLRWIFVSSFSIFMWMNISLVSLVMLRNHKGKRKKKKK